jgi:exopolysaccharide biosynthesis protein
MRKITAGIAAALLLIFATIPSALAAGAGTAVYSNTRQIADNLSYTSYVSYINGTERQNGYALNLTGKGDAYPILLADDTIYGGMTISQIVAFAEGQGRNVLAAVNTDFFSMQTGVPMGLVVEDGVYKSSSTEDTAVAFMPNGSVYFSENPNVTITLTNSGQTVTLENFNKYRMDTGGLYLFSSAFSTVSTRTSSPGWFVRFKIISGSPALSGTMALEVVDTVRTDKAQPIGDGYLVLTAADECGYAETYEKFKPGDQVTLTTSCGDEKLTGARWVTGAGDILIKGGMITDDATWDKKIAPKNPRTAFGVKADGTIVSYVFDGRESDNSSGLTLRSLAEELLKQGCDTAVNFDGGGSSALSIRLPGTSTSATVNSPSDGSTRKCGAYLLFVTDKQSDGRVKYLYVQNEGPVVLAGSSYDFIYGATDGGYMPAAAPSDIKAASGGLGAVMGTTYTAGPVHGVDKLKLTSKSSGATGAATVHIIYDPTELVVRAAAVTTGAGADGTDTAPAVGAVVKALTVWPGDAVQLSATASYYGFPVAADASAFKYSVTGDIGAVAENGLYTAGKTAGVSGSINLSVGGASVSIPVTVSGFSDVAAHWAKPYIKGLSGQGVVTGTSPTTFAPDLEIHRGDFVLMLYRAAGQPAVTGASSFTDVVPKDYYAQAIAWAEQNNIAQGNGSGLFTPQATLTREQAFTLAYRAFGALHITAADGSADVLNGFGDKAALSSYAVTPTATLVGMNVVSGADGKLKPASSLTRGEMAKILFMIIGYGKA